MITSLTDEQKALFPYYVDKWIKICLSTDPTNKQKSEEAIHRLYEFGDLEPPKEIVWFGSPKVLFLEVLRLKLEHYSISNTIRNLQYNKTCSLLFATIDRSTLNIINFSIYNEVFDVINGSLYSSLHNLFKQVVNNLIIQSIYDLGFDSIYGQQEAYLLSVYDFCSEVLGLKKETEKLQGLIDLAKTTGWVFPTKDICFVSEGPNFISLNEDKRLHNFSGPALTYPDGFKIYVIEGTTVREHIFERPWEISDDEIREEKNEEIKNFMMIQRTITWLR